MNSLRLPKHTKALKILKVVPFVFLCMVLLCFAVCFSAVISLGLLTMETGAAMAALVAKEASLDVKTKKDHHDSTTEQHYENVRK